MVWRLYALQNACRGAMPYIMYKQYTTFDFSSENHFSLSISALLFFLFFACVGVADAMESMSLSKFITAAVNNTKNIDVLNANESYRKAKVMYDTYLSSYGFKVDYMYTYNGVYSNGTDSTGFVKSDASQFTMTKKFPFLLASDLNVTIGQNYTLAYTIPLSMEAINYAEYASQDNLNLFESAKLENINFVETYVKGLIQVYINYMMLIANYNTAQVFWENQKKLSKVAKIYYEAGQISGLEYIRSKSQLLNEERNFNEVKNTFNNEKKKLFDLISYAYDIPMEFDRDINLVFDLKPVDFYLSRVKYNKEYQRSLLTLEKARLTYLGSTSALVPDLKLSSILSHDSQSYTNSFTVRFPILGGDNELSMQSTKATFSAAQVAFEERVKQISKDIVARYNDVLFYKEQDQMMRIFYDYTKKEYETTVSEYERGKANLTDLENARQKLEAAEKKLFDNKKTLSIANIDLNINAGLFIRTEDYIRIR